MFICTKRIDHKTLTVVQYNYGKARVLLDKAGKRADFTELSKAKGKVWQITELNCKGFNWTAWMSKEELDARINARLDRALVGAFERKAAAEACDRMVEEEVLA